ncbi:MAG: DEAD/DEAH box helicase family protein [Mycoplasmatales bacterium]
MGKLKFKFNENRQYQLDAINSVVNCFKGALSENDKFTIDYIRELNNNMQISLNIGDDTGLGEGNYTGLSIKDMNGNINEIQKKNKLMLSEYDGKNITVEMETGTGKTYVYLRTIMELYSKYDLKKFIIIVPSIAIREGVLKSLSIMEEHFKNIYSNITHISYKTFEKGNLSTITSFARSINLEIMIMTIDSFNKESNVLNKENEKFMGDKPITYIQKTNPIVIIDEPQSVDTTANSKEAINSLNPLNILRYSATHLEKLSLVYKLDSIDAYDKGLVKQISVSEIVSDINNNEKYMKLLKFDKSNNPEIELDIIDEKRRIKRKKVKLKVGDRLEDITNRDIYSGYIVENIDFHKENGYILFSNGEKLEINSNEYEINPIVYKRAQIKDTIRHHLDKELKLVDKGIKVLSLFFIDKVVNYRDYDKENLQGKYAKWFEAELLKLLENPKYKRLKKLYPEDINKVHDGYFSKDPKGKYKDTTGKSETSDITTYDLIMKDKERLISFEEPIRFIFSHSALKEGWDNPNVFQICTLNETKSTLKKRQEIGRGLRLCVNQQGDIIEDTDSGINRLTVIANESYEEFVGKLQNEIIEDLGKQSRESIIEYFASFRSDDNTDEMGVELGEKLLENLIENKYIKSSKKKGIYTYDKTLSEAINESKFILKEDFVEYGKNITSELRSKFKTPNIDNEKNKKELKVNEKVKNSEEFQKLWNLINKKTKYSLKIDSKKLIEDCLKSINLEELKKNIKISAIDRNIKYKNGGEIVSTEEKKKTMETLRELRYNNFDIVKELVNGTKLTRKTVVNILNSIADLNKIYENPEYYIGKITQIINEQKVIQIKDGIEYKMTNNIYDDQIFEGKDIYIDLENNNSFRYIKSDAKHLYNYVICDSKVEVKFANAFEKSEDVMYYVKLPSKFIISTPVGPYNPDWAYIKYSDKLLYFVYETKGTDEVGELRFKENFKIEMAKKHFAVIGEKDLKFRGPVKDIEDI